jgi:parallel beta-helix repeat protein
MYGKAAVAALGVVGGVALCAAPALARDTATVRCGDHLTRSVTLSRDLMGCTGDGLVVDADGVTVDLGGHTISGSRTATGVRSEHANVTVQRGTITRFANAVDVNGPPPSGIHDTLVRGITARDNSVPTPDGGRSLGGISVNGSRARIVDNTVEGGGIAHFGGDHGRVERNSVRGGDEGIVLIDVADDDVRDNDIRDVADVGVNVFGTAVRTTVEHNTIARAFAVGIVFDGPDDPGAQSDNVIADNAIAAASLGIIAFQTDRTAVRRNTVTGSGTFGDPQAPGIGIWFDGVSDSVIERNTVTGGRGRAISIGAAADEQPSARPSLRNVVARNTAQSTAADGIRVLDAARDTTLERNTASDNGADGIHVLSPSTTLTRNTADHNGDLGIEAVAGVIDGGRNAASANGDARQCTGVVCATAM